MLAAPRPHPPIALHLSLMIMKKYGELFELLYGTQAPHETSGHALFSIITAVLPENHCERVIYPVRRRGEKVFEF